MSNSSTLVHFRTIARPLKYLPFCFSLNQIYVVISFNSYVFKNNDSNPSFDEEQLPAIAARSGFGGMF